MLVTLRERIVVPIAARVIIARKAQVTRKGVAVRKSLKKVKQPHNR